jgi:hypothetical protein
MEDRQSARKPSDTGGVKAANSRKRANTARISQNAGPQTPAPLYQSRPFGGFAKPSQKFSNAFSIKCNQIKGLLGNGVTVAQQTLTLFV